MLVGSERGQVSSENAWCAWGPECFGPSEICCGELWRQLWGRSCEWAWVSSRAQVLGEGGWCAPPPTNPTCAGPRSDFSTWVFPSCVLAQWEAFSLPELQNFLRILDKEEDEQLQSLKRRYAAYRQQLEAALSEVRTPG